MGRFGRLLALSSAVIAGPLLATTAVSIRDYIVSEDPGDGFSLDGVFVGGDGSGNWSSQSC